MNLAALALIEKILSGIVLAPEIFAQITRLTGSLKDAIAGGVEITPEQFAALEGETESLMNQIRADAGEP